MITNIITILHEFMANNSLTILFTDNILLLLLIEYTNAKYKLFSDINIAVKIVFTMRPRSKVKGY